MLEEAAHLAATLADQRDDGDVGTGAAGHHAEQRALAHAAAAEQSDALPPPHGQQGIDRAHARAERPGDGLARERVERWRVERADDARGERAEVVEGTAEPVHDATEQSVTDRHRRRASSRDNQVAGANAGGAAERHRLQQVVTEADHFQHQRRLAGARRQLAQLTHPHAGAPGFDEQADGPYDLPHHRQRVDGFDLVAVPTEREATHEVDHRHHATPRLETATGTASPSTARAISSTCASTEALMDPNSDSTRQPPRATRASGTIST